MPSSALPAPRPSRPVTPLARRAAARRRWLDLLVTASRALVAAPSSGEALQAVVEVLGRAFELESVAVYEVAAGDATFRLVAAQGDATRRGEPSTWPLGEGLVGRAVRRRGTVHVVDTAADADYVAHFARTRSELVVPLLDGGEVVGVLDLQSDQVGFFSATAVEVVEAIAAQAVVARRLHRQRHLQERQIAERDALQLARLDILDARPFPQTLRSIVASLHRLCGAAAAVFLLDPATDELVLEVEEGCGGGHRGVRLQRGEGLSGEAIAAGHTRVVHSYRGWARRSQRYSDSPWLGVAVTPMRHGDELLGTLVIMSDDPRRQFDEDDVSILEGLGVAAALAIDNARQAEAHATLLTGAAEVARALGGAVDPQHTRVVLCEVAARLLGASAVTLLEPRGGELVAVAASPASATYSVALDDRWSAAARSLREGCTVVVRDLDEPLPIPRRADPPRHRGAAVQPVLRRGQPCAVIAVAWPAPLDALPEAHASLLRLLAEDAGAAIERADLHARLDALSRLDPLTGAANRRAWDEALPARLARAAADNAPLCLAMLDLDLFKTYNDVQGHQRGDLLLGEVGRAWRAQLRGDELFARYGGEEFAVVLGGCTIEAAAAVVERLRAAVPAGQTCSAGIALWDGLESAQALVGRADVALYEAKAGGRDRTVVCAPDASPAPGGSGPGTAAPQLRHWAAELPRLLEERAIGAIYQPVVRLRDLRGGAGPPPLGAVVGYEALARPLGEPAWGGVEGLFAAAEYRGMGRDLDWLCRRAALDGAGRLPGELDLFVNVGVSSLLDPFQGPDQLELLVAAAGLAPRRVVLEITEREAVRDVRRLGDIAAGYRAAGFRFALDDIGEGHATLEVLSSLLPEFLKVARSLVAGAAHPGPRAAVLAVCAFAAETGAQVVAEGLERAGEVAAMLELGVELGQGYVIERPSAHPTGACRGAHG